MSVASNSARRRRTKQRRTPEDIRDLTVQIGVSKVLQLGRPGLKQLRLEDAIATSGVPRASAYRAWSAADAGDPEARPQDRFRSRVGHELLDRSKRAGNDLLDQTIAALNPLVEELAKPGFDALTPEERSAIGNEMFRVGGNLAYDHFSVDPIWQLHLDLLVGSDLADEQGQSILGLDGPDGRIIERFLGFFGDLLVAFGARLRPGLRMEQFGVAVTALMRGMVIPPPDPSCQRVSTESGDEWSLFSVSLVGLYGVFFENDPDQGPDAEVQPGLPERFRP